MNEKDNKRATITVDALLNYETVKYFTNEVLEEQNFAQAVDEYQKAELSLYMSLYLLNFLQGRYSCLYQVYVVRSSLHALVITCEMCLYCLILY